MKKPPIPKDEDKRLQALRSLNLLDSTPEESYDCLTNLVKTLFDIPIVAISLVDAERQWFKSIQGLDVCETSRDVSFCGHAILQDDIMVIPDAIKDERFFDNPLVTDEPAIRYYAGVPLHTANGHRIGTLCILDTKPREFSKKKLALLKNIAQLLEKEMLSRKRLNAYLNEIADIQGRYIMGESKEAVFNAILAFLLSFTSSEYGFIGAILYDENKQPYLKTFAITNIAWSEETEKFYQENAPTGLEFRNLESLFGRTIKTGEKVISNDPANDKRSGGLPNGHPDLNAYLGMPVNGQSGFVAMYGLANRPGGYNEALVEELIPITNTLSAIIEATRNYSVITDMAKTDSLTHAYNRRFLEEQLQLILEAHALEQKNFCIIMADLDEFKKINDVYGHQVGDKLLVMFTQRLKTILKSNDLIARVGGDEFVMVLDNVKVPHDIGAIADRLISRANEPYNIENKKIICNCSLGVACYPMAGSTTEELLKNVDIALYEAKKTKNEWRFYTQELQALYHKQLDLELALLSAIKNDEFYYEYQPQMNIQTGKICGVEMLVRWKCEKHGQVSPGIFVPMLQSMSKSDYLNNQVVKQVINDIPDFAQATKESIRVAINISPYLLDFSQHLTKLIKMLQEKFEDLSKLNLEFEITESDFMRNSEFATNRLRTTLKELTQAGIKLAMDDFGIEYSSLNRLIEYPFNTIKIDRVFIKNLTEDKQHTTVAIVKAVIGMAKDLGYHVIAEGAEEKEQVEWLKKLGCKIVQGFYYYKPMSKQAFIDLLKEQSESIE